MNSWMPRLKHTMAKRAFQEWLEVMPSDRIMWGADTMECGRNLRRNGIHSSMSFRSWRKKWFAENCTKIRQIGGQVMPDNAPENVSSAAAISVEGQISRITSARNQVPVDF